MQVETIKAAGTYLTALIVVIGGMYIILVTRAEPASTDTRVIAAGFIGAALQFLFNQETASRASHAAVNATAAGVASQPTVTTTAGPPQTTTVTPPIQPTPAQADGVQVPSEDHEG